MTAQGGQPFICLALDNGDTPRWRTVRQVTCKPNRFYCMNGIYSPQGHIKPLISVGFGSTISG